MKNLRWLVIFGSLMLPMVWWTTGSELFQLPKQAVVYFLAGIGLTIWLWNFSISSKKTIKLHWWAAPILIWLLCLLTTAFFSIHPHTSIFGYYSRWHGGLLAWFASFSVIWITWQSFSQKNTPVLVSTLVVAGVLASLYALPERLGHSFSCVVLTGQFDVGCWVQDVQARIFGSFGQPNWLASYLVGSLVVVVLSPKIFQLVFGKKISLFIIIVSSFTLATTLLFTGSRSGVLGLLVGLGLGLVASIINKRSRIITASLATLPKTLGFLTFVALSMVITAVLIWGSPWSPGLGQVVSTWAPEPSSNQSDPAPNLNITDSGQIRTIVWQGAIQLWLQNPTFGTGPETFGYTYYSTRPIEHNLVSEWDFLYNKAHNEILQIAATMGSLGLVGYGLLWGSFFGSVGWRVWRQQASSLEIASAAGVAGILTTWLFGFSTVASSWLAFGLTSVALLETDDWRTIPVQLKSWQTSLIQATAFLILLATIWGCYQLLRADWLLARSQFLQSDQKIIVLEQAHTLRPQVAEITDALAQAWLELATQWQNDPQLAMAARQQALDWSGYTLILNPHHLNLYKSRVQLLLELSLSEPSVLPELTQTLQTAISLAPTDPKLQYFLGISFGLQNQPELANQAFQKAVQLKPDYQPALQALDASATIPTNE